MKLTPEETQKIIDICKRNAISYCALFGSFARGDADVNSDLDLLVRFSKPIGWRFYKIADEIEGALGRKIDLATEKMLGRYLKPSVMADLKVIYEETDRP